jgi:hypothetical protein
MDTKAMPTRRDFGQVEDPRLEARFRLGYHKGIGELVDAIRSGKHISLESLEKWIDGDGGYWMAGMNGMTFNREIWPPPIISSEGNGEKQRRGILED